MCLKNFNQNQNNRETRVCTVKNGILCKLRLLLKRQKPEFLIHTNIENL